MLDEPFTALDAQGREVLTRLVGAHLALNGMVIASSHEALPFATQTITLPTLQGSLDDFLALMFQQIRLGWRGGQTVLAIALFIAVTLLPFGIGPELRLLKELALGLVWVVMLT